MRGRFFSWATVVIAAFAGAQAFAQGAPITYATRGAQTASYNLPGGDDRSYGYGSNTSSNAPSVVIDVRRQPARAQSAPAPESATQGATQAPPAWLEHERVGPPYQANGRWYVPTPEPGYNQTGTASWYGPGFHGQRTATGDTYDQEALTAAHPTLPIPSLVQVTNLQNGREVIVRVTDRGPFVGNRVIDVSHKAAEVLGFDQDGTARVNVRYLGPAPRRVAANGSLAPASHVSPEPIAQQPDTAVVASGPASLLPPPPQVVETAAQAGAPLNATAQQAAYAEPASVLSTANGGFMVQVGAFADETNARRILASVNVAGQGAVDTRQTAAGAQLYRVRLGPFATREEAEGARRTVVGLGYGDAVLAAR